MKNSAAQTSEISMVWPKSGCRISGTMVTGSSSSASVLPGTSRRLAPSEKAQAARITKAGLTNSDGWMPKIQRLRALHLVAEHQRRDDQAHADDEDEQRGAPDVARRQERGREQHAHGGDQEHDLVVDEVEGREAEPLGHGGACRP